MASSIPCPDCTNDIPESAQQCPHCGRPGIFWNVIAAEKPDEVAALGVRYQAAQVDASNRKADAAVQDFENSVTNSQAVLARNHGDLLPMVTNTRRLYLTMEQVIVTAPKARQRGNHPQGGEFQASKTWRYGEVMHGVVSGRSGRALLLNGDSLRSFDVDDPTRLVSRRRADLPYLFGEASDLRFIANTTLELLADELQADCNFTCALDLTLIGLDAELSSDIRIEAIEGLQELLADSAVTLRVENVLYSHPVPDDGDLKGALEICRQVSSPTVLKFLSLLEEHQRSIAEVNDALAAIPTEVFGDHEESQEFRRVAVREGIFRALATKEERRGWGLKLIRSLMDEVEFERVDQSIENTQSPTSILEKLKRNLS